MLAERNGFKVETQRMNGTWTTVVSKEHVVLAKTTYFSTSEAMLGHVRRVSAWLDNLAGDHVDPATDSRH